MKFIPGSHRDHRIYSHHFEHRDDYTLAQVIDDDATSASDYITITVNDLDDVPELSVRAPQNGDEGVVYDGTRSLSALRSFAAGSQKQPGGTLQFWGSLPLLEFRSPAIVRLRFEAAMPVGEDAGRIDKASLVVKEDVRPMVASSKELDRIELPLPYPS